MKYVLVNRERFTSQLNGTAMWRLTWVCLDDMSVWEMTVDSSMDNYLKRGWRGIVNDDRPWGVYTGLKRTGRTNKHGTPILTADSRPERIIPIESQDLACDVIIKAQEQIKWEKDLTPALTA
jgi:hypothetical protein